MCRFPLKRPEWNFCLKPEKSIKEQSHWKCSESYYWYVQKPAAGLFPGNRSKLLTWVWACLSRFVLNKSGSLAHRYMCMYIYIYIYIYIHRGHCFIPARARVCVCGVYEYKLPQQCSQRCLRGRMRLLFKQTSVRVCGYANYLLCCYLAQCTDLLDCREWGSGCGKNVLTVTLETSIGRHLLPLGTIENCDWL